MDQTTRAKAAVKVIEAETARAVSTAGVLHTAPFADCCVVLFTSFPTTWILSPAEHPGHVRAAGFRLTVRPTVFHPRYFVSSERFAEFIDGLDLTGKHVIDIGTGSGILALAAARAGAENVTAADINPNAALTAAENARANGLGDRVVAVCSNLLAALAPRPLFDVILSSPPKHAGEPRNLADRGWHAGPTYRDIAALFDQARERLKPRRTPLRHGLVGFRLDLFGKLIDQAGFTRARARIFDRHRIVHHLRADRAAGRRRSILSPLTAAPLSNCMATYYAVSPLMPYRRDRERPSRQ